MPTARKPAAQSEAIGSVCVVEYDGETYAVPPTSDWDVEALEAFEAGRVVALVTALLGAEQWAKFKAKGRKVSELAELFKAIETATVGRGN